MKPRLATFCSVLVDYCCAGKPCFKMYT